MPTHSRLHGLDVALRTIDVPNRDPEIVEHATDLLQDCRYIGSYDWLPGANKTHRAIVVPGVPPVFTESQLF